MYRLSEVVPVNYRFADETHYTCFTLYKTKHKMATALQHRISPSIRHRPSGTVG